MKPAGSSLPSRHSTATRRSVRFTRARMMSGIAERPFSIVAHAAAAMDALHGKLHAGDPAVEMLDEMGQIARRGMRL